MTFNPASGGVNQRPVPRKTYDRCDEMVKTMGCTVRNLSVAEQALPDAKIVHAMSGGMLTLNGESPPPARSPISATVRWFSAANNSTSRTVTITRVCTMPSIAPVCAELAACHSGLNTNLSSLLTDDFQSNSGDAVCESSDHTFGIQADMNVSGLTGVDMLKACLDDANRVVTPPPAGANLPTVLASEGCASMGTLLFTMGSASDTLRLSAVTTIDPNAMTRASQIAHRAFVRFVDLYGFIARESAEAEKFGQIVRREGLLGADRLPGPRETLTGSLRGWQALLAPRFLVAIQHPRQRHVAQPGLPLNLRRSAGEHCDRPEGSARSRAVANVDRANRSRSNRRRAWPNPC